MNLAKLSDGKIAKEKSITCEDFDLAIWEDTNIANQKSENKCDSKKDVKMRSCYLN